MGEKFSLHLQRKKKKNPNDTWLSSGENRTLSAKCRKSCSDEKREEAVQRRKKRAKQFSINLKKMDNFCGKEIIYTNIFVCFQLPLILHVFKSNVRQKTSQEVFSAPKTITN